MRHSRPLSFRQSKPEEIKFWIGEHLDEDSNRAGEMLLTIARKAWGCDKIPSGAKKHGTVLKHVNEWLDLKTE